MSKGEETKKRILDNALVTFADKGYEQTSLKDIAVKSNIKAPSIYAYFSSKDHLFEEVVELTMAKYVAFISEQYQELSSYDMEKKLYHLLIDLNKYFYNNSIGLFVRRFFIIPPEPFKELINSKYLEMEHAIKHLLHTIFKEEDGNDTFVDFEVILTSYLCILDGTLIYLMNFPYDVYRKRLDDSWGTFWNGIQK
ncbi:TetR/AcrR family transcriptional regulator [Halobacillus sp. ACCC02827]|uniref:TetR/AcrR family transcriptional regulator n=1 Tax=Bacillaceae TaxID=186817 RepID=UPI0002A4F673|nr:MULTISPECIES: TetR/AcrR family transcriptional regulator [Bacillaceae]ELK45612.1 TetR family transcriptional regulator [Halobacillus sp. BAB-2008]QHT46075.1 TetR/AcrR family transcriptional regulator [Bacillus sp. SB49]WJE16887.1 TetR/AcrR family transcriptional regulator [Halobacillus sp. ACCC02827]